MEAIGLVDGTLQKWIKSVNVEYIVWNCLVVPIHPDSDDLLTVWPPKLWADDQGELFNSGANFTN